MSMKCRDCESAPRFWKKLKFEFLAVGRGAQNSIMRIVMHVSACSMYGVSFCGQARKFHLGVVNPRHRNIGRLWPDLRGRLW